MNEKIINNVYPVHVEVEKSIRIVVVNSDINRKKLIFKIFIYVILKKCGKMKA